MMAFRAILFYPAFLLRCPSCVDFLKMNGGGSLGSPQVSAMFCQAPGFGLNHRLPAT